MNTKIPILSWSRAIVCARLATNSSTVFCGPVCSETVCSAPSGVERLGQPAVAFSSSPLAEDLSTGTASSAGFTDFPVIQCQSARTVLRAVCQDPLSMMKKPVRVDTGGLSTTRPLSNPSRHSPRCIFLGFMPVGNGRDFGFCLFYRPKYVLYLSVTPSTGVELVEPP